MHRSMKSARLVLIAAWLFACRSETGGTADFTPTVGAGGSAGGSAGSTSNPNGGKPGQGGADAGGASAGGADAGGTSSGNDASGTGGTPGGGASGNAGAGGDVTGGSAGTGVVGDAGSSFGGVGGSGGAGGGGNTSGGRAGIGGNGGNGGNAGTSGSAGSAGGSGVIETAFLMNSLTLRDPHAFVDFGACIDVTDTPIGGFSVNSQIKQSMTSDTNNDGFLDLAPVVVFAPLDQASASTPVDLVFADCTKAAPTSCKAGTRTRSAMTGTNQTAGTCSNIVAGTTHPYSPAVSASAAPCFGTTSSTITLPFFGTLLPLSDAQISANFTGDPVTGLASGVMRGFLSQADADSTKIPNSEPIVGGSPLSSLLAGGTNGCQTYSDMDTDNGVKGWWFYFNFTAAPVAWSEK